MSNPNEPAPEGEQTLSGGREDTGTGHARPERVQIPSCPPLNPSEVQPSDSGGKTPMDLQAMARECADTFSFTNRQLWIDGKNKILSHLQKVDAAARDSFQNRIEGERNRYQQAISVANHHRKLAEQERDQARAEVESLKEKLSLAQHGA